MIPLYVVDIPTACNDTQWMLAFKAQLRTRFKIKDMGDLSHPLGMNITRDTTARTTSMDEARKDIKVKHNMS
jgi:hypothetical protein